MALSYFLAYAGLQIERRVDGGLPARAQQPGHVLLHGGPGDAGQHGHVLWHRPPGLALCALVILLILRDPIWKEPDKRTLLIRPTGYWKWVSSEPITAWCGQGVADISTSRAGVFHRGDVLGPRSGRTSCTAAGMGSR